MKITKKNIYLYGEEPEPARRDLTIIMEILIFIFISVILLFFIPKIAPVIESGLKSGDKGHIVLSIIIFLLVSPACAHFFAKKAGHFFELFFKKS